MSSTRCGVRVRRLLTAALLALTAVSSSACFWTQLVPGGNPPVGRHGASAVYHPTSKRMIVFGGNSGCAVLNDTWLLTNADGSEPSTWTQLAFVGQIPAARFGHTAVYDTVNNKMIVFGGFAAGDCVFSVSSLNDVWVLSHTTRPRTG